MTITEFTIRLQLIERLEQLARSIDAAADRIAADSPFQASARSKLAENIAQAANRVDEYEWPLDVGEVWADLGDERLAVYDRLDMDAVHAERAARRARPDVSATMRWV